MTDNDLDKIFNEAAKDSVKELKVEDARKPMQFEHRIIIAEKLISVEHLIPRFLSLIPQCQVCVTPNSYPSKNEKTGEYIYIPKGINQREAQGSGYNYQYSRNIHYLFSAKRMSVLSLYNLLQFLKYLENYFKVLVVEFDDIKHSDVNDVMNVDLYNKRFGFGIYYASEFIKKLNAAEYVYMDYRHKTEEAILKMEFNDEHYDIYDDCSKYYGRPLLNLENSYVEHHLYGNDFKNMFIFRNPDVMKRLTNESWRWCSKVIYGNIYRSETKICVILLITEDLEELEVQWQVINFHLNHEFLGEYSYIEHMRKFFEE